VRNEWKASKTKISLEAQGQSEATGLLPGAVEALMAIAQGRTGGEDAVRLVWRDYVRAYGEMGKQSNTILSRG
jgi:hypothetical protein